MATLYDLAMQYLNQSLPKTFKYDRTNQPGTNPPILPVQPEEPIKKILPVQGGGDGFSVYNPDPNRTRNESNYSPYNYRQAAERSYIGAPGDYSYSSGTEAQKMMDMYPDYYEGNKKLEGIPGMVQGYMKNSLPGRLIGNAVSGLESLLPVNQRAILENELLGQGFQLNDIGQFVSDGGDINKADGSNIMAGYNANKVTRQTFEKRRNMINNNMSDTNINPKTGKTYKEEKLAALAAAEDKFFGGSGKATTVFNDQLKQKDIDDGFINDQIPTYDQEINQSTYSEDEEDAILDYTNPNIYNTNSIYTSVPTSTYDRAGIERNIIDEIGQDNIQDGIDRGIDRDIINRGGGDDISYGGLTDRNRGQIIDRGSSGDPNSGPVETKQDPNTGLNISTYDSEGEDDADTGKIVCTMMNESYGFGSFRNKIWMKFHKDLSPEYQKGYHKLFLPLVRIAKTNKVVKKILEHIAVHSTIDMRQATRGKMHLLGRIYRKILLPICYFVGKHG